MKKNLIIRVSSIILLLVMLTGSFGAAHKAMAVEKTVDRNDPILAKLNADKTTANIGEKITFTYEEYYVGALRGASVDNPIPYYQEGGPNGWKCDGSHQLYPDLILPDSGLEVEGLTYSGVSNHYSAIFNCNTGKAVFSIKYNNVTELNVSLDIMTEYQEEGTIGIAVSFVDPSAPKVATPTKITPKTTTKSTATTSTKPTLTLDSKTKVTSTNQNVAIDASNASLIITTSQKLTLIGTATANAKITLTIKSDPITKEVTAGADGKWTYTLDPKELALETGSHTVTAIATDTAGIASDSIELAKFELKDITSQTSTSQPYHWSWKELLSPLNYAFVGGMLILVAGLTYLMIKRSRIRDGSLNTEEGR